MTSVTEFKPGETVRSKAKGCGHQGIFRILYRTEPDEAPSILGGGHPLAYRCVRISNDGTEIGCSKPSRIGAELYLFHNEIETVHESREK